MKRYKLTTASGKVFYAIDSDNVPLEEVESKWMGESMNYESASSTVIGVEEAGEASFGYAKKYEPKIISFNVVLFAGDKHLSMSLLAKSVEDAKKLLEDFFAGHLPAYDIFLHGTCVHQYNGQKR